MKYPTREFMNIWLKCLPNIFFFYMFPVRRFRTRALCSLCYCFQFFCYQHIDPEKPIMHASSSNKVGNNSRVKTKTIDGRGAVLFGMKVFWRLLSISFAMFTFNAMVKSMRLRKLQRPLMDIGEDRRRYSDKCQPLQKDAHQKVHRLRRSTQIKVE